MLETASSQHRPENAMFAGCVSLPKVSQNPIKRTLLTIFALRLQGNSFSNEKI